MLAAIAEARIDAVFEAGAGGGEGEEGAEVAGLAVVSGAGQAGQDVDLRAALAAIDRVRAGHGSPVFALTDAPSQTARNQSIMPWHQFIKNRAMHPWTQPGLGLLSERAMSGRQTPRRAPAGQTEHDRPAGRPVIHPRRPTTLRAITNRRLPDPRRPHLLFRVVPQCSQVQHRRGVAAFGGFPEPELGLLDLTAVFQQPPRSTIVAVMPASAACEAASQPHDYPAKPRCRVCRDATGAAGFPDPGHGFLVLATQMH